VPGFPGLGELGYSTRGSRVGYIVTGGMDGTHWGAIASGVGGIATAGALFVSLVLLRQQMRDQRRARADRHQEHASHMAFWVELAEYNERDGDVVIVAHYANTSLQPAMSILMAVGIRKDVWADGGAPGADVGEQWSPVAIGPGYEGTYSFRLEGMPVPVVRLAGQYGDPAIIGELHFTDSSGVGWVRTSRGQLIERRSALWLTLMPMSLSERDAALRESERSKQGMRERMLFWALNHLRP